MYNMKIHLGNFSSYSRSNGKVEANSIAFLTFCSRRPKVGK